MPGLIAIGVAVVLVVGTAWWARHRDKTVDSYYERENTDPPIFDAGGYLGGNR